MRVYLIIGNEGRGVSIAQRIAQEGHRALVYINNPACRMVGDGMVEKHAEDGLCFEGGYEFNEIVAKKLMYPKPDCVIFDTLGVGAGVCSKYFEKHGIPTIGASVWAEHMVIDPEYALKVFKAMRIKTKPVEGIALTVDGWFNGTDFISILYSSYSTTLMEGDRGPRAYMGSVLRVGSCNSRLYEHTLDKLLPALCRTKYRGPISLQVGVDESSICTYRAVAGFLNFAPLLEMYKGRVGDLMYGIASKVTKRMDFKTEWGMGVVLAIPPYPHMTMLNEYDNTGIDGLNRHNLKHVWMYDVHKDKHDKYMSAGCGGFLGIVTARGDQVGAWSPIRDAKRRIMRTISNLSIPDVMYRTDVGDRASDNFNTLIKWGWM